MEIPVWTFLGRALASRPRELRVYVLHAVLQVG